MPLMQGKSQKAFGHNVSAEMHAGKPQAQSLAIAYAVKRRNKKAHGGMIKEPMQKEELEAQQMCEHGGPIGECYMHGGEMHNPKLEASHMAEGGEIEEIGADLDDEGRDLDLEGHEDDFDMENAPEDLEVHNEIDNPMGMSEDESNEMGKPKKSRLLSKILGAIKQAHQNA